MLVSLGALVASLALWKTNKVVLLLLARIHTLASRVFWPAHSHPQGIRTHGRGGASESPHLVSGLKREFVEEVVDRNV